MGPFIKSKNSTDKIMNSLLIALLPIIIFTFYKNGIIPFVNEKTDIIGLFYPLIFILVGLISTFIFENLFCLLTKKESHYSIIPGIFIALVLPINTPILILIIACFIGIIFGKMIYGGFGHNIFNPALIGCLFVLSAYSSVIVNNGGYLNSYEVDVISKATPLSNVVEGIGSYETLVKPYGNLLDFFIGTIPGSVGETSSLLCLIGFIYLAFKKIIKVKIPIIYITTVFVLSLIIGSFYNLGIWYPLFQIFSGGLMFGAIFMATDPVTSPTTSLGQIIYGFCLGLLTVIFRHLTNYPEGVLTSILLMNLFVFSLDKLGIRNKKYFKKIVISFLVMFLISIPLLFNIKSKYEVKSENFKIVSKKIVNKETIYSVIGEGFEGPIESKVLISGGKIVDYEVTKCNDEYYKVVTENDYINKLKNSNDLKNIDTVSGATYTSKGLKELLINVMNDYEK